jgi:hypothetical protein
LRFNGESFVIHGLLLGFSRKENLQIWLRYPDTRDLEQESVIVHEGFSVAGV